MKSGVKFAAGTDMCWFWPGKTCGQASVTTLLNLHAAGMPSLDVIRAITSNAAEISMTLFISISSCDLLKMRTRNAVWTIDCGLTAP